MKELKKLKEVKLTELEKQSLFNRISSRISKEDPAVMLEYKTASHFFNFSFFLYGRYVRTVVVALMVIILGGATTFASLDTLPGDLLYGVKVKVVEKVPRIWKVDPASRAKDNFAIIEKRIEEFEKLAEQGRLTEENTKELEKYIEMNLKEFDDNIQEINKKQKQDIKEVEEGSEEITEDIDEIEDDNREIKEVRDEIQEINEEINDEKVMEETGESESEEGIKTTDETEFEEDKEQREDRRENRKNKLEEELELKLQKYAEKIEKLRQDEKVQNKKALQLILDRVNYLKEAETEESQ